MKKLFLTLTLATALTTHASSQNTLRAGGIRNWILDKASEHPKLSAAFYGLAVPVSLFSLGACSMLAFKSTETGHDLIEKYVKWEADIIAQDSMWRNPILNGAFVCSLTAANTLMHYHLALEALEKRAAKKRR